MSQLIENIYYAFLFFIQSGESIYDPPRLKYITTIEQN